jgi:hypothetical protein
MGAGHSIGWSNVMVHARKGAKEEAEVIDLIASKLLDAARRSNPDNSYKPFRDLIDGYFNIASVLRKDSKYAKVTLLRTAAELAFDNGRNGLPVFLVNFIKGDADENIVMGLTPALLNELRTISAQKPFPCGELEARKLVELEGNGNESPVLLKAIYKEFAKSRFKLHLVANSERPKYLDRLDIEGAFDAKGKTVLIEAINRLEAVDTSTKR